MRFLAHSASAASSWLVDLTAHAGKKLPWLKHRFPMNTTFRHCLLVNYSMDESTLAAMLPPGLEPDTVETTATEDGATGGPRAFLSVVLADLEAMRVAPSPRFTGTDFTQVVYRAIVRAPNGERGVYFVRSDADDTLMSIAGNLFSNFHFNLARCCWVGRHDLSAAAAARLAAAAAADGGDAARPDLEPREWLPTPNLGMGGRDVGSSFHFLLEPSATATPTATATATSTATATATSEPAAIALTLDPSSASLIMPPCSAFAGQDVRDAQKYFVELYAAFNSWPSHNQWSAVRIDRTNWEVVSLDPGDDVRVDFMERSSAFGPGKAELDSIFYVHALDYHWHAVDTQPLRP